MARRTQRPRTFRQRIRPGRTERIRVPQPTERPLRLRQRDLVRRDLLVDDPWWFVLHRRGVKRPRVGEDPLEARAVSKERVRGTLPERILYTALIAVMHFSPNSDFDFQSSLQGGRLELGGIVADFLFPTMRIIIRVQGPTHVEFLRMRKDEEQRGILEEMGYRVYDIEDKIIYSVFQLEEWLRRTFGLASGRGGSGGAFGPHDAGDDHGVDVFMLAQIWEQFVMAEDKLDKIVFDMPSLMKNT